MRILVGKKSIQINKEQLDIMLAPFNKVVIDIGTGDGRNIVKSATLDPKTMFIGIDPVADNMMEIARKSIRNKINNVLFVVGSIQMFPDELLATADEISIILPWGSLLEVVIKVEESIATITKLAKPNAKFKFIITYSPLYEEQEINKRSLPTLDLNYLNNEYSQKLAKMGLVVQQITEETNTYIKDLSSLWAKRLAFGRARKFYVITGETL